MAGTTGVLVVGFLAAFFFSVRNRLNISRILTAVMCGIIFSVYAATGENEGFAILWILLVPIIGMSLVGLKIGFILSFYFQVFLIVLFYTPLVYKVQQFYTSTFVIRFPVLYFASFGACTLLMCRKQDLFDKVQRQAYYDGLTDLHNRAFYNFYMAEAEKFPGLTVVSMDLNGLKRANDTLGHEAGQFCSVIPKSYTPKGAKKETEDEALYAGNHIMCINMSWRRACKFFSRLYSASE